MAGPWMPPLELRDNGQHCRLWLGSWVHGDGVTLSEAADDLVVQATKLALSVRNHGVRLSSEVGPMDMRWMDLFWELGERASQGQDVRPLLFGDSGGDSDGEAA